MSNITKIDDNALAALAGFVDDFFEDNTGSAAPSFTTYKANLAGLMDQNDNVVKSIKGYVVHTRRQVALWLSEDAGEPALSSFDGEVWDKWNEQQLEDIGDPDAYKVPVDESEYMQWSKDAEGRSVKGKVVGDTVLSAKETYVLYVLVEGQEIPVAVNVPVGSFKNLKNYKKELAKLKASLPKVQTEFTIVPAKNGRNTYASINFEAVGVCSSKEEWDAITMCAKLTKETLSTFMASHSQQKDGDEPF